MKKRILFKIIFTLATILILSAILFCRNKYKEATFETEIQETKLPVNLPYPGRGGITYDNNCYISSNAMLVENLSSFSDWKSNGPIIDFDTILHKYTLDDMDFPYIISKKANSDTIIVFKNGFVLKFLLDDNKE